MDLELTDRQLELRAGVRSLVARFEPHQVGSRADGEPAYDRKLWSELIEARLATVGFPEASGGGGGGLTDLAVVLEELGRGPTATPILNGIVLSGLVLSRGTDDPARLHSLLTGRIRYVTSLPEEGADRRDARPAVHAFRSGDGWALDGTAPFVSHAADADELLLLARTSGEGDREELGLFAVQMGAPGVSLESVPTVGEDRQCHIGLEAVTVDVDGLIGSPSATATWLPAVQSVTRLMVSAVMVGAAAGALDHATAWAKERVQFGAPIGSFQAVQHRLADALIDVITARDSVYDTLGSIDREEDPGLSASATKAYCADACRRVTSAAHQVGGGEGIYADQPLHRWHRTVAGLVPVLGTVQSHRAAVAAALLDR
jgi:alkylation response protein AidB-like acyl-CoA dehydrogenase